MTCQECEKKTGHKKLMVFIGYVDKETKEDVPTFGMSGGNSPNPGALSGVLRKFRCLQGHTVVK